MLIYPREEVHWQEESLAISAGASRMMILKKNNLVSLSCPPCCPPWPITRAIDPVTPHLIVVTSAFTIAKAALHVLLSQSLQAAQRPSSSTSLHKHNHRLQPLQRVRQAHTPCMSVLAHQHQYLTVLHPQITPTSLQTDHSTQATSPYALKTPPLSTSFQ